MAQTKFAIAFVLALVSFRIDDPRAIESSLAEFYSRSSTGSIEFEFESERRIAGSEDWKFERLGRGVVSVDSNNRWRKLEETIGKDHRNGGAVFGHLSEKTTLGHDKVLTVFAHRKTVDEKEFSNKQLGQDFHTEGNNLAVTVKTLNGEDRINSLKESWPLLFGVLFDEANNNLIQNIKQNEGVAVSDIKFLDFECVLLEFENESGKFEIVCCPRFNFAPLKIRITKSANSYFRGGVLSDLPDVVEHVRNYEYKQFSGLQEKFVYEVTFETKKDDSSISSNRTTFAAQLKQGLVDENDLRVQFSIPDGHSVIRIDEPQIKSKWNQGQIALKYDKEFIEELGQVQLVEETVSPNAISQYLVAPLAVGLCTLIVFVFVYKRRTYP